MNEHPVVERAQSSVASEGGIIDISNENTFELADKGAWHAAQLRSHELPVVPRAG